MEKLELAIIGATIFIAILKKQKKFSLLYLYLYYILCFYLFLIF